MALITQQCKVCVSMPVQVWRGVVNWLGFLMHLFVQMIRGTPSMAHMLLSYVGLGHPNVICSSFDPLPVVEIPLQETSQQIIVPAQLNNVADADAADGSGGGCHRTIEKLTVVLDLDETLVCAYETCNLPMSIRTQAIQAGLKWFELECITSDGECKGKTKINYVTVFERPGLHEFLKYVGEFADLVLFTAGLEGYARPLVDKIDVENRFSLRLYRPSTVNTACREHVKDLSCLSKDLCRIVIVDNNPFSFLLQPRNGIPCHPFSAGQPYDNQLLDIILPLLRHLSLQKDVRPVLSERFHMPQWFQMHGIPAACSAL